MTDQRIALATGGSGEIGRRAAQSRSPHGLALAPPFSRSRRAIDLIGPGISSTEGTDPAIVPGTPTETGDALRLGSAKSRPALALIALLLTMAAPQGAQAQQAEGERLFRQRCAACHSLDADGRGAGPSLAGILGREAASLDGVRYSGALSDSGLTWDAETLDQFLSNPGELVPGTTMRVRISNQAQREAIIRFLEGA